MRGQIQMVSVVSFVFLLCSLVAVNSYVPVNSNMRSFSSAIKSGTVKAGEEKTLYQHSTGQPGVITEQWFTGFNVMDERMRIRIYVDGELVPSIDFLLLLGHGIGFTESDELPNIPWNINKIGHDADGGLYNTYRIPFRKDIRITATHPVGGMFWYIVRGVENYPLVFGDLLLPDTAKLRLFKQENVLMHPLDFITVANITESAGALFQVTFAANSTDYGYLEGCWRADIDSKYPSFLSSGTEDFFLSAYYFNRGVYHSPNSGCTYKGGHGAISAYKFFENDPLLFTESFQMIWRAAEKLNGVDGCPSDFPPPRTMFSSKVHSKIKGVQYADAVVTIYLWAYVWPTEN